MIRSILRTLLHLINISISVIAIKFPFRTSSMSANFVGLLQVGGQFISFHMSQIGSSTGQSIRAFTVRNKINRTRFHLIASANNMNLVINFSQISLHCICLFVHRNQALGDSNCDTVNE